VSGEGEIRLPRLLSRTGTAARPDHHCMLKVEALRCLREAAAVLKEGGQENKRALIMPWMGAVIVCLSGAKASALKEAVIE